MNSILGTIPGWITVVGLAFVGYLMLRGQAGPAIGYLTDANTVLEREVAELKRKDAEKDKLIADLRSKTDLSLALDPVIKWMASHQESVNQRHEAIVTAIEHGRAERELLVIRRRLLDQRLPMTTLNGVTPTCLLRRSRPNRPGVLPRGTRWTRRN